MNRSDESGTTENFTDYLSKVAPEVWTHEPSGEWPVKGGEAASGTSGVVEAVTAGEGAIGYADASQAGELGIAKVKVGEEYVGPTAEAAAKILEESKENAEISKGEYVFAFELERKTESSGTYPIVLVSSLMACTQLRLRLGRRNRAGVRRIRDQRRRPGSGRRKRRVRPAFGCAANRNHAGRGSDRD